MYFLVLFGPPAVGKMTVGDEITKRTGIPVFHNHLSIEPVLRFFPFGSPPFGRLVYWFRRNLMKEAANSDLPGLIFTYVWDLRDEGDSAFLADTCKIFEDVDAEIAMIELKAELEQRLLRNRTEKRLLEKPSKRNVDESEKRLLELEKQHKMNSEGSLPLKYRHLIIDNTRRSAEDVAAEIIEALSLPRSA